MLVFASFDSIEEHYGKVSPSSNLGGGNVKGTASVVEKFLGLVECDNQVMERADSVFKYIESLSDDAKMALLLDLWKLASAGVDYVVNTAKDLGVCIHALEQYFQ